MIFYVRSMYVDVGLIIYEMHVYLHIKPIAFGIVLQLEKINLIYNAYFQNK